MSSMALYRDFPLPRARAAEGSRSATACAQTGILARIFAAIGRWHQRQAEQEAARFIAKHGARLTDDVERQLGEHLSGRGFPPYAPPRSFRPFARGG